MKINKNLDWMGELDHQVEKANIKDEYRRLSYQKEVYRQFIKLIGGEKALAKADEFVKNKLNIEETNKVLTIHEPMEFESYIKTLAEYR